MDSEMEPRIEIGAEVNGTDGKLGEISRVIVEDGEVTGVVVKHGALPPMEYVVPLTAVELTHEDGLKVNVTKDRLSHEFEPFDFTLYRMPDADYVPPIGLTGFANAPYAGGTYIALGPRAFTASGQPVPTEGLEPPPPLQHMPWSSISKGTDVVDRRGEKVGEVAELALDPASGDPSRVVVQSGFLRHRKRDLPLPWVEALEDDRIVLRVAREEMEALPAS